jgi:hypothetical protein
MLGIGLGIPGGARPAGIFITAPVLTWDGETADATPDFIADFGADTIENDVVRVQYDTDSGFSAPTDGTATIDAAAIAAGVLNFGLADLANGDYFARVRVERGAAHSAWSNTEPFTIDAVPPGVSIAYLGSNANTADGATQTFTGVSLGSDTDIVVCAHGRVAAPTLSISSVKVHVPDIATDPTGTALTEVVQAFHAAAAASCAGIFAGARPAGTTGDIVVTWSASVLRCKIDRYSKASHSGSPVTGSDNVNAAPTATLSVPANGSVIGCANTSANTSSAPTNLTEDSDTVVEALMCCTCGSSEAVSGSTAFTFTFGAPGTSVGVFAAWGP